MAALLALGLTSTPTNARAAASPKVPTPEAIDAWSNLPTNVALEKIALPRGLEEQTGTLPVESGVSLFWRRVAPPSASGVVVHFTGAADACDRNRPTHVDLAAAGFEVYCADHRGQGRSTRLGTKAPVVHVDDFGHYVDDQRAFLRRVIAPTSPGLPRYLLSTSMGGAVAFLYLERHAGDFAAHASTAPLLGLNTGPGPDWMAFASMRFQCVVGLCKDYMLGFEALGSSRFEGNGFTSDPGVFEASERYYEVHPQLRHGGLSAGWVAAAVRATWKLAALDRPVRVPTLLLQAGDESIVLSTPQRDFCARNPECRLVEVPGARHGLFEEKPALRSRVRELVGEHFRSRGPARIAQGNGASGRLTP